MSDAPEISLEADADLAAVARQFAGDALAVLAHSTRNSDDERLRVQAARTLLELGYGRPGTQGAPPSPDASAPAEPLSTADFWADFTDSDLILHYLDATREIRARRLVCGAQYYAQTMDIPLIEMHEEGGQYVDQQLSPKPDQTTAPPDDPQLEVETSIAGIPDSASPTITPRALEPGPGEMVIDCPGRVTVPYLGHVFYLRQGVQVVPAVLRDHPIVKRFIVPDAA